VLGSQHPDAALLHAWQRIDRELEPAAGLTAIHIYLQATGATRAKHDVTLRPRHRARRVHPCHRHVFRYMAYERRRC
jgi:hypothetical protein